jgi:hypothetical protein
MKTVLSFIYSDNSYVDLATLTTSFDSTTLDAVTTDGNVITSSTTTEEMLTTSLPSNEINITEDVDINNNIPDTSNIFYNEEQVSFAESVNATLSEFMTTLEYTTTIMNAINSEELNSTKDNFSNCKMNNTFSMFPSTTENETHDSNINIENTSNKNTFNSVALDQRATGKNDSLDKNNVNLDTQINISIDNHVINENIKSVNGENQTADNSTTLHINKITQVTNASVSNNISIITDSDLNNSEKNDSVINAIEMGVDMNSNTETSEEATSHMTIHDSTFDTLFTESFTTSTITTKNKDDWIFTEEEEGDTSIIPEMPTIASDPTALKELPRPMIFEDEESGRGLV